MASGLDEFLNSIEKTAKELPQFSPQPHYEPEGDSLILYVRNEQSHARRVNSLLTVYLSTKDDSLVGCEVKGVQRLLKLAGDFGVIVHDRTIRLGILLAFALVEPPVPAMLEYEDRIRELEGIEIDREDLVPA